MIISSDPGGFRAGRARYHLLPHNGYAGLAQLPRPNQAHPGDYVLILALLPGVTYRAEQRMLESGKQRLPVEPLYTAAAGMLFRVRGANDDGLVGSGIGAGFAVAGRSGLGIRRSRSGWSARRLAAGAGYGYVLGMLAVTLLLRMQAALGWRPDATAPLVILALAGGWRWWRPRGSNRSQSAEGDERTGIQSPLPLPRGRGLLTSVGFFMSLLGTLVATDTGV